MTLTALTTGRTHGLALVKAVFEVILKGGPTNVRRYDKASKGGKGDRLPESEWLPVKQPGQPKTQAIMFEGWCVGFRPLSPEGVEERLNMPNRTLKQHKLEHLLFVNEKL